MEQVAVFRNHNVVQMPIPNAEQIADYAIAGTTFNKALPQNFNGNGAVMFNDEILNCKFALFMNVLNGVRVLHDFNEPAVFIQRQNGIVHQV